jgi:AraC family transcriptional activator FtrA
MAAADHAGKWQKCLTPLESCLMHLVAALALPKVVAFDLATPAQIFGHITERNRYRFVVCAPEPGPVPTTTGFSVLVTNGLDVLQTADTIVVPGFWPLADPGPRVTGALRSAAGRGARVVSVCTGAFALAAAGLLDGRGATTHWGYADELQRRYPAVAVDENVLWVDEGQILTSAGVAAGLDLCLHIYRRDHGADAAAAVARRMVVAPYRDGGQAQSLERPMPPQGDALTGICAWALGRLHEPLTVAALARQAGWAPRTFARRFRAETGLSPHRWLTAVRVLKARQLLETTNLPVDQVAAGCGLGTAANLRLHLARDAATTPTAYRAAYQGRGRPAPIRSSMSGHTVTTR